MLTLFPYYKNRSGNPRSPGVSAVGWTLIVSNTVLYLLYYFDFLSDPSPIVQRGVVFISMMAVFPYDFFSIYVFDQWIPQMIWALMIALCAFGILLLNKFARAVFILLNILHLVVLGYLVVAHLGQAGFLENFFKLYFNVVVSGSYVSFLTLYEVRRQFQVDLEGIKLDIFLRRPLEKTVKKSNAGKYADLSVAYTRLERYQEAADALEKAVRGDPDKADYRFRLGMVRLKQRLIAEAFECFRETVARDPVHYEAYYNMGILYVQQGCSREAAEMFLKASHIRPQEAQIYRDLGDAYFSLGRFEDAVAQFRRAISLSRGDVYSYYRAGSVLTEYLDRHQEALESLRAAVRIKKNFCDAYFQLGKVCIKLKRYKEAVRDFKEVLRLQPDHVHGHYHLGFCYIMLKDFPSALRQCGFLETHDHDLADNLRMLLKS